MSAQRTSNRYSFQGVLLFGGLLLIGTTDARAQDPCVPDEDGKVIICHLPPGNQGNAQTISVAESAVDSHLLHGDTCGPCEGDDGGDGGDDGDGGGGGGDPIDCPVDEDGEVTICHNGQTLVVNENAAAAHLEHGDTCGPCDDGDGDGDGDDGDGDGDGGGGGGTPAPDCSLDADLDGVDDCNDQCPETPAPATVDDLGCGCTQRDQDRDGVNDCDDTCPASTGPADALGCDFCQSDDDNDGALNCDDNCVGVSNPEQLDNDDGGLGDSCDPDDDNDAVADEDDNCPMIANKDQADLDEDGIGDICDDDRDGDDVVNADDACPDVPGEDDGCPPVASQGVPQAQPGPPAAQQQQDSACGLCGEGGLFGFLASLLVLTAIRARYRRARHSG